MRHKWFWMTLAFWTFLGFGATTWALIHSPIEPEYEPLSHFEGRLNGVVQKHEIEVTHASLPDCFQETDGLWRKADWVDLSASLNLAPILLGLGSDNPIVSSRLRVALYGKNGHYRILGLWADDRQLKTYRWTGEFQGDFSDPMKEQESDLPLTLPSGAFNFFYGKTKGLRLATWAMRSDPQLESHFMAFCESQGFIGNFLEKRPTQSLLLTRKGDVQALVLLRRERGQDLVCLAYFPSNKRP